MLDELVVGNDGLVGPGSEEWTPGMKISVLGRSLSGNEGGHPLPVAGNLAEEEARNIVWLMVQPNKDEKNGRRVRANAKT